MTYYRVQILICCKKCPMSAKGIPVLFQGSLGSTKRLVWRVFDVEFSITNYLFWIWVVRVGRSWLIYLQRESDLLIRVSYHTQTAFEKHERAPERLPWNRNVLPLVQKSILDLLGFKLRPSFNIGRNFILDLIRTVLRQRLTHFNSAQNLKNASIFGVSIFGVLILDCVFP